MRWHSPLKYPALIHLGATFLQTVSFTHKGSKTVRLTVHLTVQLNRTLRQRMAGAAAGDALAYACRPLDLKDARGFRPWLEQGIQPNGHHLTEIRDSGCHHYR